MIVLVLAAFKGGPTKNLAVTENFPALRSVSFEVIHNLNVPMECMDGRVVFPFTHRTVLTKDFLDVPTASLRGVENYTLNPRSIYKK